MSSTVEDIRKDIRLRAEMDSMMSNVWLIVYVLPVIIAGILVTAVVLSVIAAMATFPYDPYAGDALAFGFIAGGIALVALLLVLSFVLSLILTYKLIQRRNTHFKRQAFLLEDLLKAAKAIAAKKGVDAETVISSGERTIRDAKAEETEKGAFLWAILSAIIPLASWYVNYFLMKDFYKHERREDGFWEDLGRILDKLGITISMERRIEPIPDRSFVLYLILTIITLGLFGIYWLYVLLKDPNEHFKYHIKVEDQLLGSLESAI